MSFKNFFTCNQERAKSPELAVNLPLQMNKEMNKTTEHITTVIHSFL